jgi:prepilin-type N-terminal cleavage/methylation domain-containing protein
MRNKKFGFTLGEILIALSVVGVVATLVIPMLINDRKASEARASFDTAYSLINQAIAQMELDGVGVLPSSYNTSAGSFYKALKPYFKITIDCGTYNTTKNTSVCPVNYGLDSFKDGDQTEVYTTYRKDKTIVASMSKFDDGSFVTNNGMLYMIDNPANPKFGTANTVWLTVDINGKDKRPNKLGWDVFSFELTNSGLLPVGAPGTTSTYSDDPSAYCSTSSNSAYNGWTCGYYATTNMDYFKTLYNGH